MSLEDHLANKVKRPDTDTMKNWICGEFCSKQILNKEIGTKIQKALRNQACILQSRQEQFHVQYHDSLQISGRWKKL
jgi:hypothetical protein